MKVVWRDLVTVLTEEEVLDKGFSRAKKSADRVDDPVKVFPCSQAVISNGSNCSRRDGAIS